MELRRALLLFAIVLGVAAVVTSLSSSSKNEGRSGPATPPPAITADAPQGSGSAPAVRFNADRAPATKALRAGRAGTVTVSSEQPGEVRIDSLGLSAAVEPSSPAAFNVYETEPGRHGITLEAAGGVQERSLGVLAIQAAR